MGVIPEICLNMLKDFVIMRADRCQIFIGEAKLHIDGKIELVIFAE